MCEDITRLADQDKNAVASMQAVQNPKLRDIAEHAETIKIGIENIIIYYTGLNSKIKEKREMIRLNNPDACDRCDKSYKDSPGCSTSSDVQV